MKIEEYVPTARPINNASERSFSVPAPNSPAPTKRIDPTGRSAISDVFAERTSV